MKKLAMTLLAGALSLPLTFAATQGAPSASNGQTTPTATSATKKTTKSTATKKRHHKKHTGAAATNNAAPATSKPATK